MQEPIGHGGAAVVYKCLDTKTGQSLAAKLAHSDSSLSEKARVRFLTEARTMSRLQHPNVVRVHHVGEEQGSLWYVMDLATHGSIYQAMRRQPAFEPVAALDLALQVLLGLDHAHRAGLVHRDVKPHNMLLFGETQVRITDFGIARVADQAKSARITGAGDMLGTLAYMAPEQRIDPRRVGPVADIFGVGATLYVMLTKRRPLDLSLAKLDPTIYAQVPEPIRHTIRRATAQRPEDRYPSARSMARAICEALEHYQPSASYEQRIAEFDEAVGLPDDTHIFDLGEG